MGVAMRARSNIIVADDVAEIQNLVAKFLEPFGYRVRCASSGREASKLMKAETCDILIADVLMPDGDGIELIQEARRCHAEGTKILAISGGGGGLQPDYCISLAKTFGAHATLVKPFDRRKLMAAVEALRG